MGDGSAPATRERRALASGAKLGRYVLEDELGRGGMGEVYAAYDPRLDRRVAIKLLHSRSVGEGERARLLREGQAIAALSHPNVIEVYDAGQDDDGVFLAMELLAGVTLRDWAVTAEPTWRRVIEVYQAAGRGLAAAHAAGLVHRDFKPANVMLTSEGRVVVLDFGLVQADGTAEQRFVSQPGMSAMEATGGEERLTQTGFVLGTPAYMAPEQAHGGSITAYCDQFALCVALFEALYGHRPFAGSDTATRVQACQRGEIQRPPTDSDVPARVEQVLARGLSHDPEQRWPSIEALLDALQAAIERPRRSWIAGSVLGVAIVGLATTAGLRPDTPEQGCDQDDLSLAEYQDRLRSDDPYDGLRLEYARTRLSTWSEAWRDTHQRWCSTTHAEPRDAGACFAAGRERFAAIVDVIAEPELSPVQTRSLLALLDAPTDCIADDRAAPGQSRSSIGAELVEHASSVYDEIRQADEQQQAGRLDQAQAHLDAALALATSLERPALRGLVLLEQGSLLARRSNPTEALRHYEEAYAEGNAGQDDGVAAEAAIRAAQVEHEAKHDEAAKDDWLRAAQAVLDRAGPMPEIRAHYLQQRALTEKDPNEAIRWFEQQRPLVELRGDELGLAYLELNLGSRHEELGRIDTAIAMTQAAIPRLIEQLGDDHRMTARARINLGRYHRELGDTAKELELYSAALPALEASGDREGLVALRVNIAAPLAEVGRRDEALEHLELAHEEALAIWGADHLRTATVQGALGLLYDDLERYEDAERLTVRAMETRRQLLGPDDPWVGRMLVRLGNLARDRERFEDALTYFDQAIAAAETSTGADSHEYGIASYSRGITLRDLGRVPEGIAVIEPALELMARHSRDDAQLAKATLALAKAYWANGDKERARAIAGQAATLAEGQTGELTSDIAQWREAH